MGVEMCDDMGVEMIFVLNKKLFFTFFRPNLSNLAIVIFKYLH